MSRTREVWGYVEKGRTGKKKVVECIRTHVTRIELYLTKGQGQAVSGSRNEERERERERVLSQEVKM